MSSTDPVQGSAACERCKSRGVLPDTILGESPCTACAEFVRLSVLVSREAADALKKIAQDHGWSITETVRRLIALGKFAYDEDRAGHRLLFHDGKRLREVELLP